MKIRYLIPIVLLAACSHAPISQAQNDSSRRVTIRNAPLKVGDRFRSSFSFSDKLSVPGIENSVKLDSEYKRVIVEEMLSVVEGRRSRWSLRVIQDEINMFEDGNRKRVPGPLAAKSLVLWYENGRLHASYENSQPVNGETLANLKKIYGPEEKSWRTIFDVLESRTFVLNQPVRLSNDQIRVVNRGTNKIKSMEFTLRRIDEQKTTASFEQVVVLFEKLVTGPPARELTYKGHFKASLADGIFMENKLEGQLEYEVQGHQWKTERGIYRSTSRLGKAKEK